VDTVTDGRVESHHRFARITQVAGITRVARITGPVTVAGWCAFAGYVLWQGTAGAPLTWTDTTSYAAVAGHPLWSTGFWAGSRPPFVPLLLKLTWSASSFTATQSVIAVLAWGLLALVVGRLVTAGWRRLVAVWVVLGFAASTPVILWNRSVLSESLSLSLLAVLVAALIAAARRMTWPRIATAVVAALAFAATRDAQVWTVALIGVGVAAMAFLGLRRHRPVRRRVGALALGLLVAAGATGWDTAHTGRTGQNVADVLFVRIFPFPGRVAWFAGHGMPEARTIDQAAAALAAPAPGAAEVVGFQADDPMYAALENWIATRGASTYLLWLATHPGYVLTEPFERPEQAFNYAQGDLTFYAAPGRSDSPLTGLLWPAWWWLGPMALVGVGAALITGTWRERSWQVVVALGAVGIVAMLIAWHGDGEEVPRHTVEGFAQLRLAVLVLCTVGVLRLVPWRPSEARDARRSARSGPGPDALGQTDGGLA
jgi:hypothetical protein